MEAEIILETWRAKANYFQGAEDSCRGFGAINALFVGSNDPLGSHRNNAYIPNETYHMVQSHWASGCAETIFEEGSSYVLGHVWPRDFVSTPVPLYSPYEV